MKSKGQKKVEVFREGESEEYNSEVDGEPSIDTPKVNYDILGARSGKNQVHKPLMDLILRYEELPEDFDDMLTYEGHRKELQKQSDEEWRARVGESFSDEDEEDKKQREPRPVIDVNDITRDFLSSDQSFVFSDEMIIYDTGIVNAYLVIVDQRIYIMFKESLSNMYTPFDLEELAAVIMSPSNPMSAAFRLKDHNKMQRSHIIFQNQNMGLMIRFIQELEAYWLSVEFAD